MKLRKFLYLDKKIIDDYLSSIEGYDYDSELLSTIESTDNTLKGTAGLKFFSGEGAHTGRNEERIERNVKINLAAKFNNIRFFTNSYLYHFLNFDAGKWEIQAGMVGATQLKLHLYSIKRIKFMKPNTDLIVAFKKIIEPIDQKIMILMNKNRNLTAQRDMLLLRLMSGKLEV